MEKLFRLHKDELVRFARRYTGDISEAEDIVQEAFARFMEKGGSVPETMRRAWLFRVVLNMCHDTRRKAMRAARLLMRIVTTGSESRPDPLEELIRQENKAWIERAVKKIGEKNGTVLVLRYYHDLTYQEISEILSIPPGTVMSRLSRARHDMARLLDIEGGQS